MQIVIDIKPQIVDALNNENEWTALLLAELQDIINNGTPLPKGHGDLIDAGAFERRCMFDSNIEDMQDVIYALRDYKPIIEADKESEE